MPSVKKTNVSGSVDCTLPSALRNIRKKPSSQFVDPVDDKPVTSDFSSATSDSTSMSKYHVQPAPEPKVDEVEENRTTCSLIGVPAKASMNAVTPLRT